MSGPASRPAERGRIAREPRAGILITGTEVLTGIISDRNGPWLSERLREIGVDAAMIQIVGDRPDDLLAALRYMEREGMALVVTSGGLGPDRRRSDRRGRRALLRPRDGARRAAGGADRGDPAADDEALARARSGRDPRLQPQAGGDPEGATVLEPVGTAPGLVVAARPAGPGPPWSCCPGRPVSCSRCGRRPRPPQAFRDAIAGATTYRREIVRLFGIPESEIANTLRAAETAGMPLAPLEITTCLRRGEIEIATRYEPPDQAAYDALLEFVAARHADALFSLDGATVDEQVARLLLARALGRGRRVVHRRPDGRAADRAAGFLGLLRRRHRRLLQRGEDRAGRASTPR